MCEFEPIFKGFKQKLLRRIAILYPISKLHDKITQPEFTIPHKVSISMQLSGKSFGTTVAGSESKEKKEDERKKEGGRGKRNY